MFFGASCARSQQLFREKINVRVMRVIMIFTVALMIAAVLLVPATPAAGRGKGSVNQTGQAAFKGNCAGCHGADGAGTSLGKSLQAPDLRSQEVQKRSDAELAQTIAEGRNNMPSFKQILDPDQLQAVVGYVRELGKTQP
jgi:mono/diheme cytochrome c family protein